MKKTQNAFTIMEILIVVVILSITSAFALNQFTKTRAKTDAQVAEVAALKQSANFQIVSARKTLVGSPQSEEESNCAPSYSGYGCEECPFGSEYNWTGVQKYCNVDGGACKYKGKTLCWVNTNKKILKKWNMTVVE